MFRLRKFLRLRHDDKGAAAIEAALTFPFIVLLGSGLFEFGSVFYNYEMIQTGVRDAARYLARVGDLPSSETAARNLAVRGTVNASAPLRVSWWQAADVQIIYRTTPNPIDPNTGLRLYRGNDPLTVIRVSTDLDYNGIGLLNAVGLGPVRVTAAHEERYVGQ
jgi:hypothetical protein